MRCERSLTLIYESVCFKAFALKSYRDFLTFPHSDSLIQRFMHIMNYYENNISHSWINSSSIFCGCIFVCNSLSLRFLSCFVSCLLQIRIFFSKKFPCLTFLSSYFFGIGIGNIKTYPLENIWPWKKDGNRHFSRACCDRARGNSFKLNQGQFRLNIRKKCFAMSVVKCWTGCPEKWLMPISGNIQDWVGQGPEQMDLVEDLVSAHCRGTGTKWALKVFFNQYVFMIIWF